jgi:uncharacterized protein YtpQ (UPF0354 family)
MDRNKIISVLQKEISQEHRRHLNKINELVSASKKTLKLSITDINTWKGFCDNLEAIISLYQTNSENQLEDVEKQLLKLTENK